MSVKRLSLHVVTTLLCTTAMLTTNLAHARDWVDWVTTPFVDPLLVRPPVLDIGKVLPGDTQVHVCDVSIPNSAKPFPARMVLS